jgi:hypothetical protein
MCRRPSAPVAPAVFRIFGSQVSFSKHRRHRVLVFFSTWRRPLSAATLEVAPRRSEP